MNRNSTSVIVLAAMVTLAGCQHGGSKLHPQNPVTPPTTTAPTNSTNSANSGGTPANKQDMTAQVSSSVTALLAQQATAKYPVLPKGVKLRSVTLKGGIVTLNFNAKFNALANMGDTTEAEAQKALRTAVGAVAGVTKMNVMVEGKPFNSQMTDWSTPFDVHYNPSDDHDNNLTNEPSEAGSNQ